MLYIHHNKMTKPAPMAAAPAAKVSLLRSAASILGIVVLIALIGMANISVRKSSLPDEQQEVDANSLQSMNGIENILPQQSHRISEISPEVNEMIVRPGMRAVTITIDERTGVEGFARPGERVDVIWTHVTRNGNLLSEVIAQNAKVLSLNGALSARKANLKTDLITEAPITLEMSVEESLKLLTAKQFALLSLVLRSADDATGIPVQSANAAAVSGASESKELSHSGYCPSSETSMVPVGTKVFSRGSTTKYLHVGALSSCYGIGNGLVLPGMS